MHSKPIIFRCNCLIRPFSTVSNLGADLVPQCDDTEQTSVERDRTLAWVRNVVVGLNLCPFAEKPLLQQRLHVVTVDGVSLDDKSNNKNNSENEHREAIVQMVATEGERLVHSPGTTLVVCPDCFPTDFESFMDVVQSVETMMAKEKGWEGILQVAPFHPRFQFAGSTHYTDPDNRTNQSPYPMIHILRETEVTQAVEQLPEQDAAVVWSRNVDLLETLATELHPNDFDTLLTNGIQALPSKTTNDGPSNSQRSTNTVDIPSEGSSGSFMEKCPATVARSAVRQILRRFPIHLVRKSDIPEDDNDDN